MPVSIAHTPDSRMAFIAQETATGCSCSLGSTDPQLLESQRIPLGFCGHCDACGAPGHIRHFPGALPVTGTWCDRHYGRTVWLHPVVARGQWIRRIGRAAILTAAAPLHS